MFSTLSKYLTHVRFGPFARQLEGGRLVSPILSVTPSIPIRFDLFAFLCFVLFCFVVLWGEFICLLLCCFSLLEPFSSVNPEAILNQAGIFISIVLSDQGTYTQLAVRDDIFLPRDSSKDAIFQPPNYPSASSTLILSPQDR
jgi:hypothetical protein